MMYTRKNQIFLLLASLAFAAFTGVVAQERKGEKAKEAKARAVAKKEAGTKAKQPPAPKGPHGERPRRPGPPPGMREEMHKRMEAMHKKHGGPSGRGGPPRGNHPPQGKPAGPPVGGQGLGWQGPGWQGSKPGGPGFGESHSGGVYPAMMKMMRMHKMQMMKLMGDWKKYMASSAKPNGKVLCENCQAEVGGEAGKDKKPKDHRKSKKEKRPKKN